MVVAPLGPIGEMLIKVPCVGDRFCPLVLNARRTLPRSLFMPWPDMAEAIAASLGSSTWAGWKIVVCLPFKLGG